MPYALDKNGHLNTNGLDMNARDKMSVTTKQRILKKIDKMHSYNEKLEYLNSEYLKSKSLTDDSDIMEMIKELKEWGQ